MHRNSTDNNSNGTLIAHPACASCKHQRKKCAADCILAPYFPAEKIREFQAVHKYFGVSNMQKIVSSVKEDDRRKVADSLIWEAFCRQKDPVLGPYGEFRRVLEELKLYKTQNCIMQLPNQGGGGGVGVGVGLTYKTTPAATIGWNNGSNVMNSKGINAIGRGIFSSNSNINSSYVNSDNGNSKIDLSVYGYPSYYVQNSEKSKQESRDVASVIVPFQSQQQQQQHQQHIVNAYNQQSYFSGQFG